MEIADFERMLPICKSRLDDELELQAELQWRIAQRMTQAATDAATEKDSLARLEAQVASRFADLSVAKVQEQVRLDRGRISAVQRHQDAVHNHALWVNLHGAWISRGYSLKSLCDLHHSNYFAVDSHTVRDRDTQHNRDVVLRSRSEATRERTPAPARTTDAPVRRRVQLD